MTDELKINGKAIYTTKGAAREYGRIGCNFYTGCPHNCTYCYLKRGAPSKQLGGTEVRLKKCFKDEEDARQVFIRETWKHIWECRQHGVFFSFTTDPMTPKTREMTLFAVTSANHHGIPVKILTKDACFVNDDRTVARLCSPELLRSDIHIGFTLTGRDDMEPNADSNADRIDAMRRMKELGFKTFASIEPVIDWQHARMVIDLSLDCCDHYKIGMRSGVKKDYYDLVASGMNIRDLTEQIVKAGRTVYLKESTRALLRRCFIEEECERILSMTVDMDGKPYHKSGDSEN
jgi:hypothetical protein